MKASNSTRKKKKAKKREPRWRAAATPREPERVVFRNDIYIVATESRILARDLCVSTRICTIDAAFTPSRRLLRYPALSRYFLRTKETLGPGAGAEEEEEKEEEDDESRSSSPQ